jgi:mono/diheme cytochrome c family protein
VRRAAVLAVLAAVGFGTSGCDLSKPGGKTVSPTPVTVVGKLPQTKTTIVPAKFTHGDPKLGKKVFLTAGCTSCHTLKAANSHGTVGPNLDEAQPDINLIVERVTKGRGAMPPFGKTLSTAQIANVTAFVYDSTHGAGG